MTEPKRGDIVALAQDLEGRHPCLVVQTLPAYAADGEKFPKMRLLTLQSLTEPGPLRVGVSFDFVVVKPYEERVAEMFLPDTAPRMH